MPVCAVCPIAAFSSQPSPTVLLEAFANVPDPRKRKGRIHPLPVILGLAACSNAAGHTTPTEIGEWCRDAPQQLLASLGARYDALTGMHLAPSRDTVARVLAALEPDLLDCALGTFLATLSADTPETNEPEPEHIALDGKVLRGSRGDGYPPVMLISAYAPARGAILAQREVNAKSNEVRREALCRIPTAGGRNSEGGSWTRWLTRSRKAMGTRACHEDPWPCPEIRSGARRSPRDMAKAVLPEPQSPAMQVFIHRKRSLKPVPCPASCYLVGDATSGTTGDVQ